MLNSKQKYKIKPLTNLKATITLPADKSISHRALMVAALADQQIKIQPFLDSKDTQATLDCLKQLGVKIKRVKSGLLVQGQGILFKPKSSVSLWANESGTTLRILSGILVGQKTPVTFNGAKSLLTRPMNRIVQPLKLMGADIFGVKGKKSNEVYPPLSIRPVKQLNGLKFTLPVASAQVKSAILFAGLYANTATVLREPVKTRDHTERMLKLFGVKLKVSGNTIKLKPQRQLYSPKSIFVPGDFSSAAFFIVLGLILPNSIIKIKNVNINPTRTGLLNVLKRMQAKIEIVNLRNHYEPYADLIVKSSQLKATTVNPEEIPAMIDEIPILAVAASYALGKTEIRGVKELKVKETDRLHSMLANLKAAGVNCCAKSIANQDYALIINGRSAQRKYQFKSFNDHRTAMSMIVFGCGLTRESILDETRCIAKSFPDFINVIKTLAAND